MQRVKIWQLVGGPLAGGSSHGTTGTIVNSALDIWSETRSSKMKPRLRAEWAVSSEEELILASCCFESDEKV